MRYAKFDFIGTECQVLSSLNFEAIAKYTVFYCLHSLTSTNISVNQDCLGPIHLIIFSTSILSPPVVKANLLNLKNTRRTFSKISKLVQLSFSHSRNFYIPLENVALRSSLRFKVISCKSISSRFSLTRRNSQRKIIQKSLGHD